MRLGIACQQLIFLLVCATQSQYCYGVNSTFFLFDWCTCVHQFETLHLRCLLEILYSYLHEKYKIRISYFSWDLQGSIWDVCVCVCVYTFPPVGFFRMHDVSDIRERFGSAIFCCEYQLGAFCQVPSSQFPNLSYFTSEDENSSPQLTGEKRE